MKINKHSQYKGIYPSNYLKSTNKYWTDNASDNSRFGLCKNEHIYTEKNVAIQWDKRDAVFFRSLQQYIHLNNPIPFIENSKMNRVGMDRIKLYVKLKGIDFDRYKGSIEQFIDKENNNSCEVADTNTGEIIQISNFKYI